MDVKPPTGATRETAIIELENFLIRIQKGLKGDKARSLFIACFEPLADMASRVENIKPQESKAFYRQYYMEERRIKAFLIAEGTEERLAKERAETLGNMVARISGFSTATRPR